MKTPEHFWSRVDKTNSCWLWTGGKNNTGYGSLLWQGRTVVAHRVAALLSGMIESAAAPQQRTGGGFVLHTCDTRACVNPAHLEIGTYAKNQRDAYARSRRSQPQGEHHTNAKLTSQQVIDIRNSYANGKRQTSLASIYGVSQTAISHIIRKATYRECGDG